jgi:Asp-tRNA(Asn)/Glu-tRNA(Gln) amidotransferase A subunit family amidase
MRMWRWVLGLVQAVGLRLVDALARKVIRSRLERPNGNDLFLIPAVTFNLTHPPVETKNLVSISVPAEVTTSDVPYDKLAFKSIVYLASLLKNRQMSAIELCRLFFDRQIKFDPQLKCIISYLHARAEAQARQVDAQIERDEWKGWLHGIPWGIKDLFAVAGYPTTWGSQNHHDQTFDFDAAIVEKLDGAGAICLAKLSTDSRAKTTVGRWFGGQTKTPWNLEEHAGGSSCGPAAAVSAGLLPFSVGTETSGSITIPAERCGVIGLRPTNGRISRFGCLPAALTMDRVGIFTRYVNDAALVFSQSIGIDCRDPSTVAAPFEWGPGGLQSLRIGYVADQWEGHASVLKDLERLGATLIPITTPEIDVLPLFGIKAAESAWIDHWLLRRRQDERISSNRARAIAAVDYLELQRQRTKAIGATRRFFDTNNIEVYLSIRRQPPGDAKQGLQQLLQTLREPMHDDEMLTWFTGLPVLSMPIDQAEQGLPTSAVITGSWWREDLLLTTARALEEITQFNLHTPAGFSD